ncbi:MAG: leucine-rich repeat domain-containing protein [Treponema sp.]|nr:leucine-rich repeat domain-containing protein [Treponema sp.]
MGSFIKKNGLLYSEDSKIVLGVDDTSTDFTGRVPYGAHKIDDDVFSNCPYESISLPDSVTELGNCLFENSKALETVKLPANITELPPYLFSGCSALSKVTMPNTLSGFPEGLFKNCESMPEIPFRAGIKVLAESVFEGCSSLKALVIPNTVTRIESKAVANCTSLESVVFPSMLEYIAPDAFEGCTSIHNIRIDGEGGLFYVGENDGCLYEAADEGDKIVVQAYSVNAQPVSFFTENVDEVPVMIADEDDLEEDDTFSSEIGAGDEEFDIEKDTTVKGDSKNMEDNAVDSMLADILGEEKERSSISEGVGISEQESEIISETMSVMSESNQSAGLGITDTELEKLFEKNEEEELASQKNLDDPEVLDSKLQILTDSVEKSTIIECTPTGELAEDPELYVVAEKLAPDELGNDNFSRKLVACCKTFARIQDYKKIILLYGLPLDNDEFTPFFRSFISKKNVLLACEAESPSKLSDYGKKVCELARISLKKDDLAEQRRSASIKTKALVKLVIRDKYE